MIKKMNSEFGIPSSLQFQERLWIRPLAFFLLELLTFIDQDLAVVGQGYREPFQRTGRRSLKVDAVLVVSASVTRALELLLGFQPVGRTA